jgi:DNA-binding transcriptional LysR family regulator
MYWNVMDLVRLKTLRELANRETMAAVAKALHMTPSGVSQQIAQLEEEAGVALTERHGRRVKLTHAGHVLVTHIERVLGVLDEARSELADIRNEISGTLRIAAFATAAAALLPQVIHTLRQTYPRLQVTLVEMEPAQGLAALGSRDVDIAIVDDLSLKLARLEKSVDQVFLLEDELRVAVTRGHRLASKEFIDLTDLKDENSSSTCAAARGTNPESTRNAKALKSLRPWLPRDAPSR